MSSCPRQPRRIESVADCAFSDTVTLKPALVRQFHKAQRDDAVFAAIGKLTEHTVLEDGALFAPLLFALSTHFR